MKRRNCSLDNGVSGRVGAAKGGPEGRAKARGQGFEEKES